VVNGDSIAVLSMVFAGGRVSSHKQTVSFANADCSGTSVLSHPVDIGLRFVSLGPFHCA